MQLARQRDKLSWTPFISADHQIQIEAPSPQHAGVVFLPVLLDPKGTVIVEHIPRSH